MLSLSPSQHFHPCQLPIRAFVLQWVHYASGYDGFNGVSTGALHHNGYYNLYELSVAYVQQPSSLACYLFTTSTSPYLQLYEVLKYLEPIIHAHESTLLIQRARKVTLPAGTFKSLVSFTASLIKKMAKKGAYTFSSVSTGRPSIRACKAQIGSIFGTMTLALATLRVVAQPFPTSPYPQYHCNNSL
eukprot:Gb_27436 [translate_table: standard]